jgi:hypothetical protein
MEHHDIKHTFRNGATLFICVWIVPVFLMVKTQRRKRADYGADELRWGEPNETETERPNYWERIPSPVKILNHIGQTKAMEQIQCFFHARNAVRGPRNAGHRDSLNERGSLKGCCLRGEALIFGAPVRT